MAIVWDVTITSVDADAGIVSLAGTTLDNVTGVSTTVRVGKALFKTKAERQKAYDILHAKYLRVVRHQGKVSQLLGSAVADAKVYLEAK